MNHLPSGFESLRTEKSYWKMSELKEGENRIRIVQRPIAGWVDWQDKKPYRYQPHEKPSKPFNADMPIKPFWCCYVWDYAREALFILEITQNSVIKALTALGVDPDWGDFIGYDIKLSKQGTGKDTKYLVTSAPHKPMPDNIAKALADKPANLDALYFGGDPWSDLSTMAKVEALHTAEQKTGNVGYVQPKTLEEHLKADGISTDKLADFLKRTAEKKGKTVEEVVASALHPSILPAFKASYIKDLEKQTAVAV